jgi:hypothetical protein
MVSRVFHEEISHWNRDLGLEYMGRTTSPSGSPTPLRTFGSPKLNQILDALSHDFRRWVRTRDYRKCDVLGIANDGLNAELLEVTTVDNAASAIAQLNSKLAILRETVNRIHNMSVDWRASTWRPAPAQLFRVLDATPNQIRYICYMPTLRAVAPLGVTLYEIHSPSPPAGSCSRPCTGPHSRKGQARRADIGRGRGTSTTISPGTS